MKKQVFFKLFLLMALVGLLAACGPAVAPAPQEEPDEAEQAPAAEAEEEVAEEVETEAEEAMPAGEAVASIVVLSNVQAQDPIEFESTRLLVDNMKQLGLDVEHKAMPWEQQADLVWFNRGDWQMTAWRMVGRPERMDPDEFVVNLFSSDTAEKGYNFVGFISPEYDELALKQRGLTDREERRQVIYEAQEIIAQELPYLYVAHPKLPFAYRNDVWNPDTIVDAQGIGIKNFWTWIQAEPVGDQKDFLVNTGDALVAINPLYIAGDAPSRITEIIYDRLMRIGPDGLAEPWAAESVEWEDDTNLVVKLRDGMMWHDGEPVTPEDVAFSFQAPMTDEAPMYKPFVSKIANVEIVDDSTVRFTLSEPWVAFETASLAKLNLIPKHIWGPIIEDLAGTEDNAESYQEEVPIGSGPYKFVAWKPNEELILEANTDHWAAPNAERWIVRIIPNVESAFGQLQTGEINFLMEWEGDASLLQETADADPNIDLIATTELGFRFFAMNNRLPPFDDPALRRALAHAVPKEVIINNIFKGFAEPADSYVSMAIDYWHNPDLPQYEFDLEQARAVLEEAGYTWNAEGQLLLPTQ